MQACASEVAQSMWRSCPYDGFDCCTESARELHPVDQSFNPNMFRCSMQNRITVTSMLLHLPAPQQHVPCSRGSQHGNVEICAWGTRIRDILVLEVLDCNRPRLMAGSSREPMAPQVMSPKRIAVRYMSAWFLPDVVAGIPWETSH